MTCWLLVGALEVLPVPKKVRCYPCYSLIFPEACFKEPANNMITFCSGTTGTESGCVRLCGTICQR